MHLNTKILGLSAFVSYFGLDVLTTCIGVFLFGIGTESNPAMFIAMSTGGLAGFILLKLILSLSLVLLSLLLAGQPDTKAVGESALMAILAGGLIASTNNFQALLTGTSLIYMAFGQNSYFGPGVVLTLLMLFIGLTTYAIECLKDGKLGIRAHL